MPDIHIGRVAYGKTITDAWKGLWKGATLWGVVATGWLVNSLLVAGLMGGAWAVGLFDLTPDDPEAYFVTLLVFYAAVLLMSIVGGLIYLGMHGASAYAANQVLAGNKPRYLDALKAGYGKWFSIFGYEFLLIGTVTLAWSLVMLLFGLFVTAMAGGGGDAGGLLVVLSLCCFYAIILLVIPVAGMILFVLESVGLRQIVVADRGAFTAYRQLWTLLRRGFKQVFLMGLLYLGLMWAYQMVTSIITTPISLLFMGDYFTAMGELTQSTAAPDTDAFLDMYSSLGSMYAVLIMLSLVLAMPLMTFTYLLMGSFYRQLTGIEPPPEPQQYQPMPPGQQQQAPPYAPAPAPDVPVASQEPLLPPVPGAVPPPPPRPATPPPSDSGETPAE